MTTFELVAIEGSSDHAVFTINQANGELAFIDQPDRDPGQLHHHRQGNGRRRQVLQDLAITVTDSDNEYRPVPPASSVEMAENETAGLHACTDGTATASPTAFPAVQMRVTSAWSRREFDTAPDRDPGSADGNNDYEVEIGPVTATAWDDQTVTVTVTDANDDPVFSRKHAVSYESTAWSTPQRDRCRRRYAGLWPVGWRGSGAVQPRQQFRCADLHRRRIETLGSADANNDYEVEIEAADGNGGTTTQTVTVTVTDANDDPAPA